MKLKVLLHNSVIKNAEWMVGEQLVQMVISFVLSIISTRYLGPSNFGIINYCSAYVAFFSSISALGLEGVLVKELVTSPDKEGLLVGTSLVMRICSGLFSVVSITVLLIIVKPGDYTVQLVGLLQSLVLLFKAFEVFDFWFQSKLKSKYVSLVKIVSYVLVAVYKVFILATAKSVLWFAFSTSLDFLIIALMLMVVYPRQSGPKLSFSWILAKDLLKNSYHFILSSFFVLIYTQMDKLMIEAFFDETQVGYYGIATTIYNYWALVLTALINAIRPSIISAKSVNEGEYVKRLKRLYALLAYLCFAAALFFTFFGKFLIPLVYGDAYRPSVSAVTITMWYAAFSLIGTARGIWIVCENKNKYVKYYVIVGAVANFVLNYTLIPPLGINGAAIATLITQIITCVIAPILFKETRIHSKYVVEAILLKGIK